ncbi:hypothetical protein HYU18_01090 [Candidatus Woesearchaeota archaeon]|nr:hypothetical protein [Candidatus Woesearchaeota archaeon]
MAFPILIAAAAVVGGFVLLRILTSGRSSPQSRKNAEKDSLHSMSKIRAYEQQVEALGRRMKAAPDKQRELMAKRMELLLKQKELLKHKTERLVKKS